MTLVEHAERELRAAGERTRAGLMRPGELVEIECDCGATVVAMVLGDKGQLLEWYCPVCRQLKRDTNA